MMARYTTVALLCILIFVTLPQYGLGLSAGNLDLESGAQLKDDDIGTVNMINEATLNIEVHCHDYAGPVEIMDMGDHNVASGSSYMNFVPASTTSILCSFNLGGVSEQDLAIWVNNDPNNTLPIECIDCRWVIDEQGFSLLNPGTGKYILVAGWVPADTT